LQHTEDLLGNSVPCFSLIHLGFT